MCSVRDCNDDDVDSFVTFDDVVVAVEAPFVIVWVECVDATPISCENILFNLFIRSLLSEVVSFVDEDEEEEEDAFVAHVAVGITLDCVSKLISFLLFVVVVIFLFYSFLFYPI